MMERTYQSTMRTVTQQLDRIAEEICENYCKYPDQYKDYDEMLNDVCDGCPLNRL